MESIDWRRTGGVSQWMTSYSCISAQRSSWLCSNQSTSKAWAKKKNGNKIVGKGKNAIVWRPDGVTDSWSTLFHARVELELCIQRKKKFGTSTGKRARVQQQTEDPLFTFKLLWYALLTCVGSLPALSSRKTCLCGRNLLNTREYYTHAAIVHYPKTHKGEKRLLL